MKETELISMRIISSVGAARSMYIEAIRSASQQDFAQAEELIRQGDEAYQQGQQAHARLLQEEAAGKETHMTILLAHAEDQLMSAESFKILSEEFMRVYQVMGQMCAEIKGSDCDNC